MHKFTRRCDAIARLWAHQHGAEDATPAELAEEAAFRQRLKEYDDQWRYVKARHARAHFLRVMGTIPADWPCAQVDLDPCKDWEAVQPADDASCRFWVEVSHWLYDHIRLAEALAVSPAELPLWDDLDYWRAMFEGMTAHLSAGAAAGDADASMWLAVYEGRAEHPETLALREAYRRRLAERWGVPLAQIPPATASGFFGLLWRYPQSERELLRRIRDWRRTHPEEAC